MSGTTFLLPYPRRWDQFRKSRFHQISERLASKGHSIHVIQAPATDSDELRFSCRSLDLPENVILHEADLRNRVWNSSLANKVLQEGYHGIGVSKQVRRLNKAEDVDVLWLYNSPHYELAKIDSIPIVFDVVDDHIAMLNSELDILLASTIETLERRVSPDCCAVVT